MSSNVEKLRLIVKDCIEKQLYSSAIFFADKLVTLSGSNVDDVYWLAHTYYESGQYKRALHLIQNRQATAHARCRYLAAQCLYATKDYEACLEMVGPEDDPLPAEDVREPGTTVSLRAAMNVLRGRVYEELDNREKAVTMYRAALSHDVYCFEAYERLVDSNMLTAKDEIKLLSDLNFTGDDAWLKVLYAARMKKYGETHPVDVKIQTLPDEYVALCDSLDVAVARSEEAYTRHDFRACHDLTKKVLEVDPCHDACLPIHVATLYELNLTNELFYLAHRLVDTNPDKALSWFSVACYYLTIRDQEQARRYFSKATSLDGTFGPAWLGFGHSFAAEGEHDQAMAAYRKSMQLFRGNHLPQLCIGMEYVQTSQLGLAEQHVHDAKRICPTDPLVWNELGVIYYMKQDYNKAVAYFHHVIKLCGGEDRLMESWEPTVFNLAHAYRKMKDYDRAREHYELSLRLKPKNGSAYAALAFTHHLLGNLGVAVEYYHKALALRPEDTFSVEMLAKALGEFFGEGSVENDPLLSGP